MPQLTGVRPLFSLRYAIIVCVCANARVHARALLHVTLASLQLHGVTSCALVYLPALRVLPGHSCSPCGNTLRRLAGTQPVSRIISCPIRATQWPIHLSAGPPCLV